jgi:hypothetical protein
MFPGMEQVSASLSVNYKICLPCRTKSKSFERVAQLRFLGKPLKKLNSIHEEINSRFILWIACYHLVQNFCPPVWLSKNIQRSKYKTVILPLFCRGVWLGFSECEGGGDIS